jgi:N-acetylglutamate synthase-like GNAT family acetyltransferase
VEEEGKIVGAGGIKYKPQSKAAVISWDMIKPTEHGKGIGRKLTQHRIQHINTKPDIEKIIVRTPFPPCSAWWSTNFSKYKILLSTYKPKPA